MLSLGDLIRLLKNQSLRKRLVLFLMWILIYRITCVIPLPGINLVEWRSFFSKSQGTLIDFLDMFGGGGIANASIASAGIYIYIIANTAYQVGLRISSTNPIRRRNWDEAQGYQITKVISVILTLIIGTIIVIFLQTGSVSNIWNGNIVQSVALILTLTLGSSITILVAEQVGEKQSSGYNLSLLIWSGVLVRLYHFIFESYNSPNFILHLVLTLIATIITTYVLVKLRGLRRNISLTYPAHRVGTQTSRASGMLPIVFHLQFVTISIQFFYFCYLSARHLIENLASNWVGILIPLAFVFSLIASILVFLFSSNEYFETLNLIGNLDKTGARIPGISQGKATENYLIQVNRRIMSLGFLLIPSLVISSFIADKIGILIPFFGAAILVLVPRRLNELLVAINAEVKYSSLLQTSPFARQERIKSEPRLGNAFQTSGQRSEPKIKPKEIDVGADIRNQINYGHQAFSAAQYAASKFYYENAYKLAGNNKEEYIKASEDQIITLHLGVIANSDGKFIEAKGFLETIAKNIFEQQDQTMHHEVLLALGIAYKGLQEWEKAKATLQQGFSLSQNIPDKNLQFKIALEEVLRTKSNTQVVPSAHALQIIGKDIILPGQISSIDVQIEPQHNTKTISLLRAADYEIMGINEYKIDPGDQPTKIQFSIFPNRIGLINLTFASDNELYALPITVRSRNPYQRGKVIHDEYMFFGRKTEVDTLRYGIQKISPDNFLIVGRRRIGKSSLLAQIEKMIQYPLIVVPINLQSIGTPTHLAILRSIILRTFSQLEKLDSKLLKGAQVHITEMKPGSDMDLINYAFQKDLDTIFDRLDSNKFIDTQLILLIDEADYLLFQKKDGNKLEKTYDTVNYIRSLLTTKTRLNAVIAGTIRLLDLGSDETSPFYNIAVTLPLLGLSLKDSRKLIEEPMKPFGISYLPEALSIILDYGGTNPYYLQYIGYGCIEEIDKLNQSVVNQDIVANVVAKIADDPGLLNQFQEAWEDLTPEEREILIGVARADGMSISNFPLSDKFALERLINLNILRNSDKIIKFDSRLEQIWTINLGELQYVSISS